MKDIQICAVCGRTAECEHHLIFGFGKRNLAEEDELKLPLCNACHNMGKDSERIHGNSMAERLSKMLGQALWERKSILNALEKATGQDCKADITEEVRGAFMERYGRSYL